MEQTQDKSGVARRAGDHLAPWSTVDELNWAADRKVLRDLKKRGEEPSEWLATEYRELKTRRAACRG